MSTPRMKLIYSKVGSEKGIENKFNEWAAEQGNITITNVIFQTFNKISEGEVTEQGMMCAVFFLSE